MSFNLRSSKVMKKFRKGFKRSAGRNHHGKITCRHRGGGHKRVFRQVLFGKTSSFSIGDVVQFEYNPNGASGLIVAKTKDGCFFYAHRSQDVKVGDSIISYCFRAGNASIGSEVTSSCLLFLKDCPVGSAVFALKSGNAVFGKSEGCFCRVLKQNKNGTLVQLPSGKLKLFSSTSKVVIGISYSDFSLSKKKAGAKRWKGFRPSVRGVAINPVDHPHGGGEGKGFIGRHPVNPWGRKIKK